MLSLRIGNRLKNSFRGIFFNLRWLGGHRLESAKKILCKELCQWHLGELQKIIGLVSQNVASLSAVTFCLVHLSVNFLQNNNGKFNFCWELQYLQLIFPFCVFLLCRLNKLLEQSTQTKFSLFLISVSAETPRQPRTRRKRKSTNANSSAPSSGMNSTSGKKKSPSTSGFTLASQDVMVVGEPSLMGGEFGDEDERLITRWVEHKLVLLST